MVIPRVPRRRRHRVPLQHPLPRRRQARRGPPSAETHPGGGAQAGAEQEVLVVGDVGRVARPDEVGPEGVASPNRRTTERGTDSHTSKAAKSFTEGPGASGSHVEEGGGWQRCHPEADATKQAQAISLCLFVIGRDQYLANRSSNDWLNLKPGGRVDNKYRFASAAFFLFGVLMS